MSSSLSQEQSSSRKLQSDESKVKIKIITKFEKNYLRNNRLSTQKNLRCFPACPNTGHSTTGSCSCGCVIELSGVNENSNAYTLVAELAPMCNEDLFTVGKFYSHSLIASAKSHNDIYRTPIPNSAPHLVPRQAIPEAKSKPPAESLRDKDCWRAVHLPSGDENRLKDKLTYFIRPSYWHYGWRSHKHMRFMQHSVRLYAFVNCIGDNDNMVKCVARSTSTYFTVNSYKGKRIAESKSARGVTEANAKKKRKLAGKTGETKTKMNTSKPKRRKTVSKQGAEKKRTQKKSSKSKKVSKQSAKVSVFSPPTKADASALLALAAAAALGEDSKLVLKAKRRGR